MQDKNQTIISAIARTGYVAKGLVYLMVGVLTLQATLGMGGETSDATDAFSEFIEQPFGSVLMIGIIAGLIAHAIWKMLQGIIDPEDRGDGFKIIFLKRHRFFNRTPLYLHVVRGMANTTGGRNAGW